MNIIIQQIATKLVEEIAKDMQEHGIGNIGQAAKRLSDITKSAALDMLQAAIEQMDLALVSANKERRKDSLRIKERDVKRSVLTDLGELHYKRTYFEAGSGERCYLVDHLIGVEAYERLTKELCASLVQQAAEQSMAKAAKYVGTTVSRQTVNSKVLALKEVVTEAAPRENTPRELHVFMDEDHVHMKNGRNAIVPLLTVTEGIDSSKKRHKTINAVHFEGYGITTDSFFENVSSYLHEAYCMEEVERIYVHADGGQWIKGVKDWLPNAVFVMDGFHLQKRLRQIGNLTGAASYMSALRKSIREDCFQRFVACCVSIDKKLDELGRKRFADHVNFIENHWDAVILRMQNDICGSCTEPLVSHVLSSRLSRNPIAWSDHGLRQMAMLRVYVKNGGVVTAKDIRVSRSKADLNRDKKVLEFGFAKYRSYAVKQVDAFLKERFDWSLYDKPLFRSAKLDGTSLLLKACGQLRNTLASA